jgi:CrcB protein
MSGIIDDIYGDGTRRQASVFCAWKPSATANGSCNQGEMSPFFAGVFVLSAVFFEDNITMFQYVCIAVGGAAGALARYLVGTWVSEKTGGGFPWGTLVINMSGCFILGLIGTLLEEKLLQDAAWRPLVTIGFVGAYTTFSTYEYETAKLGSSIRAFFNLIGSVVGGYSCVWIGIAIAHWISSVHIAGKLS